MRKTQTALIIIVFVLLAFGIVMLASTSGIRGQTLYDDPYHFAKRQVLWLAIALLAGFFAFKINYQRWHDFAVPFFLTSAVLLILVFVPGIGLRIGGSHRWIHAGFFNFQPSELAKLCLILILAWWMSRERRHAGEFVRGAFIPMAMMGIIVGLIFIEPDFGTALLCTAVGMAILFVAGARVVHLLCFAVLGLGGFSLAVMHDPIRLQRILAFLHPDEYVQTYSFQLVNAINAFIAGGIKGVGYAQSLQKQYYLPEAHTDFIFAIIGEELGVVATLSVILLFVGLFACGMRISFRAPDLFGRFLAFGITLMITAQAAINIAVVTGCLPTKGLTLPFISFGGSSLVMSVLEIGLLLNIAQQGGEESGVSGKQIVKDKFHNF